MTSRIANRTYETRTTFTSRDYTTKVAKCQGCGETIRECVLKDNPPPPRVECHECLARWFNNERIVRTIKQTNQQRNKSK